MEGTEHAIRCVFGHHYDAVYVDGHPLSAADSLRVFNHSPDGFAWGYGGSGPSQLALALLLYAGVDEDTAVRLHQEFKHEFVARWPQGDFETVLDIAAWVARQTAGVV